MDDGSTDGTREIIDTYKDPRIRYVWQENQERSAARNHGIGLAKGSWMCFQDSDDEYLGEHLDKLFSGIKSNPGNLVFIGGITLSNSFGTFTVANNYIGKGVDTNPCSFFTSGTYHRQVFKKIKFDENYSIAEDTKFLFELYDLYDFVVLNTCTTIYYNDVSGKVTLKSQKQKLLVYKDLMITVRKKRKAAEYQFCFVSFSILYHSKSSMRELGSALNLNIKAFRKFPIYYLMSIIEYIKIRVVY